MPRKGKPKLHPVTQYAADVVAGKILAGKFVRLACNRHLNDLKTGKRRGLHFDETAADHIIAFFKEFLVFYDGAFEGQPFILTPHEAFIVGSLFGWKRKDEMRRFRTAYIEEGKGQGKSPLSAGVGLYGLVFDGEPGAEIYSGAVTYKQASIVFRDASIFAEKSEALREMLTIEKHNIAYEKQNSFFRPVSSETRSLDGPRPHFALIDEIHEHPDDLVVRKMSAGTKGRRQSLVFEITNAGYDRQSICYQHHDHTAKILEGIIEDDAWFGIMSGLDVCPKCEMEGKNIPQDGCLDCDDWRDEAVWEKANPNLNYLGAPFRAYLRRQVEEAKSMPSQENIVKRFNFCIWVEGATKWIPFDKWDACSFPVDAEALTGRVCYGGLDLAQTEDLTAWVMVFPPLTEDGKYEVLCRFFIPKDNVTERGIKHKVPYQIWARDGLITLTPGNFIDEDFIIEQIRKDSEKYNIEELAFDAWGSSKIISALEKIGFYTEEGHGRLLVKFRQGDVSMNPAMVDLYKLVLTQKLAHGGNPILSWHCSNTVVEPGPTGLIKPDKQKATEKIDGIVALVMAVGRAMLHQGPAVSAYETPGTDILTFG